MILDEIQPFLKAWDAAWARLPAGSTPAQRRAHFEIVAREMREPDPAGLTTSEHWIEVPDRGRQVRVRAFIPEGAGIRPALIYMHGGAYMQGSPETHWDITSVLATRNDHVVISVDYALAPEMPFPAAVEDCAAVVRWTFSEGADALNLRPGVVAIGGDSAGANLAAAMTLKFRGSAQRLLAQLLIYPGLDFRTDRPSHIENANGPIVLTAGMPTINAMYCPDLAERTNPLAAPLCAPSHADLPPAYIAVAEHDPLRDDGLEYVDKLRAAGVRVDVDTGRGLIHGYLRSKAWSPSARASLERMAAWLRVQMP